MHFRAVFGKAEVRQVAAVDLLVGYLNAEAVAELFERLHVHFFGLVGNVLAFAGLTHAVTFDGFGQDYSRTAVGVVYGFIISGINFVRVVAAAVQGPDFVVRHIGHEGFQLRRVEEVFANVRTVFGFEGLVVAVQAFFHTLFQGVVGIACQEAVPAAAPNHFQHIPARTAEVAFQFLNDFAVTAYRAVQTLQVAVDYKDQVVQAFAGGQCNGALAFRLVHLAVAAEAPYFATFGFGQAARFQVFQEARLVNRHQRAQAHGYGGELPEIRQQMRVRVRRQAVAANFLAEIVQLVFAQTAFHEGTSINAGCGVALNINQVAFFAGGFIFGAPEMVETHVIESSGRCERGNVAAQFQIFFTGTDYHGGGIPADGGTDAVFQFVIAGRFLLFTYGNGVQISSRCGKRQVHAAAAGVFHQIFKDEMGTLGAFVFQYRT